MRGGAPSATGVAARAAGLPVDCVHPAYPSSRMHATLPLLKATDFPLLRRRAVDTLQVNLGYTCNQS